MPSDTTFAPRVLCFGEVLWDLLPSGPQIGGAPLNAAYHLHQLGAPVAMLSRVGDDERGRGIAAFLASAGMHGGGLQVDPRHPTGIVDVTLGENQEVSYHIVEEVAWDYIQPDPVWPALGADYLVYGSLAARSPVSRATLNGMLDMPLTRVLDVNLRPPHYTEALIGMLMEKADIVKMNTSELREISGWYGMQGDVEARARALCRRTGLGTLIVTDGAGGAYLLHEGDWQHAPGRAVHVVDTVGSGDAFLAGFLAARLEGGSPREALEKANRMGAFVAERAGGCPPYRPQDIP